MNLIIKDSILGKSVFTNEFIKNSEKILDFKGKLIPRYELPVDTVFLTNPEDDRFLQVSEEIFLGPSGEIDDIINHSCNPNTVVIIDNMKATLFAIKDIEIGEEITYDYSLQMYNEPWTMKCRCGSKNCRSVIREYKFLPQDIKNYYLRMKCVPSYNEKM